MIKKVGWEPGLYLFLKLMFGLSLSVSVTELFWHQSVGLKDHGQRVRFLCYPRVVVTGKLFLCSCILVGYVNGNGEVHSTTRHKGPERK
jgi:hypothetical protein